MVVVIVIVVVVIVLHQGTNICTNDVDDDDDYNLGFVLIFMRIIFGMSCRRSDRLPSGIHYVVPLYG